MSITSPGIRLLSLSLLLVFGGGLLAWLVQTDFGGVEVRDVRFQGPDGATLSALLHVPATVSAATPAPAILAIHGYINSRETQSPYAIELARRGYVVLNMDQRGHGYSDPPAFAAGFGGPAGLAYLRSLPEVDPDRIGLIGHSMGGWAVLSAAASMPDAYETVIVSGSSTGTFGVPPGDAEFPRNFALVFGKYDEFSATMWQAPSGAAVVDTERLKTQFGTTETVVADRLYGSLADGTGRRLYQPAQTHPANHITRSGIGPVLDWMQVALPAPSAIPPSSQRWPAKEFGTLLSLVGGLLFLFAFGAALLRQPWFAALRSQPAPARGIGGPLWWPAAGIFVLVPAFTYFPFQGLAGAVATNAWLGQNLTTGFMFWALGNALVCVLLLLVWHFLLGGRKSGNDWSGLGLAPGTGSVLAVCGRALLLAAGVVGALYLVLLLNHWLFTADFRFWVVALKPMNRIQLHEFLVYLLPFTAFFLVTGSVLHGQLRGAGDRTGALSMLRNAMLAGGGIALLLAWQYVSLFTTGALAIPAQALLTIVAIQFVVLLPLTALVSTWFFARTGTVYTGAFVNGLFITWLIVAGQATHFAF